MGDKELLRLVVAEINKGIDEARKSGVNCGQVRDVVVFTATPKETPAPQCTDKTA